MCNFETHPITTYQDKLITSRYDYVMRCAKCDKLIGEDIPFDETPDNYLCDDCFNAQAIEFVILFSDGTTEIFDAQPENIDTPTKLQREASTILKLFLINKTIVDCFLKVN